MTQRRGIVRGQVLGPGKREAAQRLKREMTPAERLLWERLRQNGLGLHFRRQQVIAGFIADFYCASKRLAIEIDGAIHDDAESEDGYRSAVINAYGIRVVRFANREVFADMETVLIRIVEAAAKPIESPDESERLS